MHPLVGAPSEVMRHPAELDGSVVVAQVIHEQARLEVAHRSRCPRCQPWKEVELAPGRAHRTFEVELAPVRVGQRFLALVLEVGIAKAGGDSNRLFHRCSSSILRDRIDHELGVVHTAERGAMLDEETRPHGLVTGRGQTLCDELLHSAGRRRTAERPNLCGHPGHLEGHPSDRVAIRRLPGKNQCLLELLPGFLSVERGFLAVARLFKRAGPLNVRPTQLKGSGLTREGQIEVAALACRAPSTYECLERLLPNLLACLRLPSPAKIGVLVLHGRPVEMREEIDELLRSSSAEGCDPVPDRRVGCGPPSAR